MNEERLIRMETMLTDLIRIVGSVKSELTNVKSELTNVKSELTNVKSELTNVKLDVAELKNNQELFRDELFAQSERIDKNHKEVMNRLDNLESEVKYALNKIAEHDLDIFKIKERLAV